MEVAAKLKGAKMSAQKARLVADQIRGKEVGEALDILNFSTKKGAHLVRKLLESAIANAEHNEGADVDELKISTIMVDEGLTMKRIKPRAKGRADLSYYPSGSGPVVAKKTGLAGDHNGSKSTSHRISTRHRQGSYLYLVCSWPRLRGKTS